MGNKTKRPPTSDALEILRRRYVEGNPEMHALVEQERANAKIAKAIYDLRTSLGLSQRDFAKRVKTSASVVCRLEDAEYEGHSTGMLVRIAAALGQTLQMEVCFVPNPAGLNSVGKSNATKRKAAGKNKGELERDPLTAI